MFPILSRKLILTIISFFFVLNLGLWYWLNFSLPQNVEITDLTPNSTVIVWTTAKKEPSSIFYSPFSVFIKLLPLSLPLVEKTGSSQPTQNHRIALKNLKPNQKYYLAVISGVYVYKIQKIKMVDFKNSVLPVNEAALPVLTVKTDVSNQEETNISGAVASAEGKAVAGSLVIARNKNGDSFSALTDQKGEFKIKIPTLDGPVFLTARNGINKEKTVAVPNEIVKQPVLLRL